MLELSVSNDNEMLEKHKKYEKLTSNHVNCYISEKNNLTVIVYFLIIGSSSHRCSQYSRVEVTGVTKNIQDISIS